jgi:hypothetical protein
MANETPEQSGNVAVPVPDKVVIKKKNQLSPVSPEVVAKTFKIPENRLKELNEVFRRDLAESSDAGDTLKKFVSDLGNDPGEVAFLAFVLGKYCAKREQEVMGGRPQAIMIVGDPRMMMGAMGGNVEEISEPAPKKPELECNYIY